METIEAVFRAKAVAYSKGDLTEAFKSIVLPTTIYVGEKTLFIETQEQLVGLIRMSRDALLKFDYDHTNIEIISETALKSDRARVAVLWRHFDKSGAIISTQDATYYCARRDNTWQISLAEMDDGNNDPAMNALPLR